MMVIIIIIPNMFIFALQWFLCSSAFKKPPSRSLSFPKSPPVSIVIKGINCQTPFAAELAGGLRPAITSLDKNLGYIRKAIIDPSTDHAIMMMMTMTLTMIMMIKNDDDDDDDMFCMIGSICRLGPTQLNSTIAHYLL